MVACKPLIYSTISSMQPAWKTKAGWGLPSKISQPANKPKIQVLHATTQEDFLMGESNLLEAPSQVVSHPPKQADNGNPMLKFRKQRAVALVPTVRPVFGGFRVSSSCRDIHYLVTQPNGHLVCTCPDFLHHEDEPDFRCKHAFAVELALEEDRVPTAGNGQPPAPAEASLVDGLSVVHRYLPGEDPVRLKLIKNTKGYSWEISVADQDPNTALGRLQDLERHVKAQYGETPPDPS